MEDAREKTECAVRGAFEASAGSVQSAIYRAIDQPINAALHSTIQCAFANLQAGHCDE